MSRWTGWRRYVRPARANLGADVDDELRFHIDLLTAELAAHGWSEHAARIEAERRFGAIDPVRRACLTIDQRRSRRLARADIMGAVLQDVRFALRSFRRAPGFSIVAAITLALGIGATTTMYSVIDGVLLRPLPYPEAERLVVLADVQGDNETPSSFPEYMDWRARGAAAFSDVATSFTASLTLAGDGEPEALVGDRLSANLPAMLGIQPLVGRSFRADDDAPSAPRVIMLAEELWRRRFNAEASVVGRVLQLGGRPYTVVGVFPSNEGGLLPSELASTRRPAFWVPLRLDEKGAPRDLHFLNTIARLRPGVTPEAAGARAAAMAAAIRADGATTHGIRVAPLAGKMTAGVSEPLVLLLGAVGMLLLIACANVANLLLARAAMRQREFAVRAALGAARYRIATQVLVESVVRALAGGAMGIGLAYGAVWAAHRWLTIGVPRFAQVTIDGRVLAVAVAVSMATGVLFGLVPARRAARGDLNAGLREGGRGVFGSAHRDRVRRTLIAVEVALSVTLLVGAGLLLRSLVALTNVPKGFDMRGLTTAAVALPTSRYPDSVRQQTFYRDLVREVGTIPGVRGAALASSLPIEGGTSGDVTIDGKTFPADDGAIAEKRVVSADYLLVLGATVRSGRLFDARDVAGAPPVVIVNEAFAKRYLPGEQAVGRRVDFAWETTCCQTIVGVVADLREGALNERSLPAIYIPVEQRSAGFMFLVVRTSLDAARFAAAVRTKLKALDPLLPVTQVRTLDDVMAAGISRERLSATLVTVFAALALVLAGIGLYGVVSYSVVQRTQELGVRSALGATGGDIVRMVLRQGLSAVAIGGVAGVAGALASGRVLASHLYGVGAHDTVALIGAVVVLGLTAVVAAGVPALRAARADPLDALRSE